MGTDDEQGLSPGIMLTITGSAKIPRSATRFRFSEFISSPRRLSISQAPEGATPSRSSMFINSRRRSFTSRARKFPSAASGTQLMISMPGRRIFLAERREPDDRGRRGVDLCEREKAEREKGRVAPLGRPGLFPSLTQPPPLTPVMRDESDGGDQGVAIPQLYWPTDVQITILAVLLQSTRVCRTGRGVIGHLSYVRRTGARRLCPGHPSRISAAGIEGERLAVVEKGLPRAGYLRHFLILGSLRSDSKPRLEIWERSGGDRGRGAAHVTGLTSASSPGVFGTQAPKNAPVLE